MPYVAHTLEADGPEELVINCDESRLYPRWWNMYWQRHSPPNWPTETSRKRFADNLQKSVTVTVKSTGTLTRLHYIADWINNGVRNGFLQDVTGAMSPDTERLSISYMSSHPQLYKQLANSPENIAKMKKIEQSCPARKFTIFPKPNFPPMVSVD